MGHPSHSVVFSPSAPLDPNQGLTQVEGPNYEIASDRFSLLENAEKWLSMGFQGTQLGRVIEEVERMIKARQEPVKEEEEEEEQEGKKAGKAGAGNGDVSYSQQILTSAPQVNSTSAPQVNSTSAPQVNSTSAPQVNSTSAPQVNSTSAPQVNSTSAPQLYRSIPSKINRIWLSFSSNLISSGLREIFVYLAKHQMIDVIVTTAGGIEEDFIKCLAPSYIGEFHWKGAELRNKGWNRIGNLIVPNTNYCLFEDWLQPLLDNLLLQQKERVQKWNQEDPDLRDTSPYFTPSELINYLGQTIQDEKSLYYWCWKNDIPVFCPAITDGSIGDNLYFHSYRNPGLILDVVRDMKKINDLAIQTHKSGMIILGGGAAKHHTCNANLMRNGADFAVYINTAQEYDGSDSGAKPDEAISWGKIRSEAKPIKVHGDATYLFPIIVSSTFTKYIDQKQKRSNQKDK